MTLNYICMLPDSNMEFDDIEATLRELGVKYEQMDVSNQKQNLSNPLFYSRIYRISETELAKLPLCPNSQERYLPVEDPESSGHKLSPDKEDKFWNSYIPNKFREQCFN